MSPPQQTASPSSRMPKRPTRLAPTPSTNQAEPAPTAAPVRPAAPKPAEEASTMVLPNWREELAQLRKEQERAAQSFARSPEQAEEKVAQESLPLPRRSFDTPLPQAETQNGTSQPAQAQSPLPETSLSYPTASEQFASQATALPAEPTQRQPTPLFPVELPGNLPGTPLPLDNPRATETARRELRIKVWEQAETIQFNPFKEEHPQPGPAPAVEQNPLASVAFSTEERSAGHVEQKTVPWQAPLSPPPASPSQERQQLARQESQGSVREEQQPVRQEESAPANFGVHKAAVEDQPTIPLSASEIAGQEPVLKIERASTPAPKKWAVLPVDEIVDLPTRPMAASTPPVADPTAQPPVAVSPPAAARPVHPATPTPAAYVPLSPMQPQAKAMEIAEAPLASRGRPVYPGAQPAPSFNPPSLPPFPQGPLAAPGNAQLRPEMQPAQGPQVFASPPSSDVFSSRQSQAPMEPFAQYLPPPAAQLPPVFEPAPISPVSATADASKSSAAEARPRKKRKTAPILMALLLVVLLAGGVAWYILYQPFTIASASQPYQTYRDSAFGISLNYTPGWSVNIDQAHTFVHFIDSSHTGQVNLSKAAANGQVSAYLQQQAGQLGVNGPKASPALTFAGSSWQAIQGTSVQSGATYALQLYATQHNDHFYLLEFLAPQQAFASTDQNDFAPMRSSFAFI
ncbi:MAG TPA: hypothetical protein VGD98_01340 [Ktedonobacteraceae bacterium]